MTGAATHRCSAGAEFRTGEYELVFAAGGLCAGRGKAPEPAFLDACRSPRHGRAGALPCRCSSRHGYSTRGVEYGQGQYRNEIRFILNGEDVALSSVAPEALLDWLRLTDAARHQEGCRRRLRRLYRAGRQAPPAGWSTKASMPASASRLARRHPCHRRAPARRRNCIPCSRRWSISTVRNAASARRASSCRFTACGWSPEPGRGDRKALQGNPAAAPITRQSCRLHAPSPATVRQQRPAGGRAQGDHRARRCMMGTGRDRAGKARLVAGRCR